MPTDVSNDIKSLIDDSPMSGFQMRPIGVCFLILMLDGFDALVMSFTGPTLLGAMGLKRYIFGRIVQFQFDWYGSGCNFSGSIGR
jgi:MFS transporter, AAHS family, 4-hydroxybenzoate transporter